MKKFIIVIFLFLGMAVVALSFGELENTLATLEKAHLRWLFVALALELVWMVNVGLTYQSIFHLLGIEEDRARLTLVAAASNFVNIVAPTAGVGGIAVFANEARRRGYPPGKATLAGALFLLVDQAAFLVVLALGWVVLLRRNDLNAGEVSASLLLLAMASILAFLLYLGYRSADALGSVLARMARTVNRVIRFFLHRDYLSEERAHAFAAEVADGLSDLPEHSALRLSRPLLHALFGKLLLIGALACAFLSFDVPFSAGTIVAGWAIGFLFLIVSPTPNGIGVVEGLMPLTLTSLRVPYEAAVVVTLLYRAVTFWFLLAVGAWAFRRLHLSEE
ncbi:MAG: flippase-like domain-containing protein [Chloroflexi bacterium]|nr:flippase-like domain-containing protein [Chloroflexota bacterium]